MTTKISITNIQPSAITQLSAGPAITNIQITDNSYNVLDDTAVSTTGGFIRITGTNFASGCSVVINNTNATSVTFVNSTTLNVQVPGLSAGTYIVYVINTDGGVAIRVNGLTYSGTPTWATGSTLPTSNVDSNISIQLSASSDSSVTYALNAGSTLPAGLTLSSSGLLSGTITGISSDTTYNFTINAIDIELQESPRTFSITVSAGDLNWSNVATLISSTSARLPFNADESTNNFNVSIFGDTRPNNFNPYTPGYYSATFDGNGDRISTPAATNYRIDQGDWTWEGWIYPNVLADNQTLVSMGVARNAIHYVFNASALNGAITMGTSVGTWGWAGQYASNTGAIKLGQWNHFAFVRSGNNLLFFANGSAVGSVTSANFGSGATGTLFIGTYFDNTNGDGSWFNGIISNLRFVQGTALYTGSTYTVPTTPLTAITNTRLLLCQSNRFIDNSPNAVTLTTAGNVGISGFDPFVLDPSFASRGSTYFDGTGDFLNFNGTPATTLDADFTVEAWVYPSNVSTLQPILCIGDSFSNPGILFYIANDAKVSIAYNNSRTLAGSGTVAANAWNHLAFVRSGSTITAYLNGVSQGALTTSATFSGTTTVIGREIYNAGVGGQFVGYISNLRLAKGTAVYTSAFTPPATPLTAIANTSLLTCQTNQPANNNVFIDNSTNTILVSRTGNTTQGTFSPYGESWSNYFDGNGDYLRLPASAMALTNSNFTIEMWVYLIALPTSDAWPGSWSSTGTLVAVGSASTSDGFNCIIGSTQMFVQNNDTKFGSALHGMTTNRWYHLAYVRSGNTITFFVNGVSVGSTAFSGNVGTGAWTWIASETGEGSYINGYISNLRVVRGTALYTSTFTPSTTPLQPIAGTILLTCKDSNFVDDSTNLFAITRFGDATVQKFSPFAGTTLSTPLYSGYFDGTGDFLTCGTNNAFAMGTGDFTAECWINFSGSSYRQIFSTRPGATTSATQGSLAVNPSNGLTWYTSGFIIDTATNIGAGLWHHIALTRSGTTLRLFLNGTQIGTATNSDNLTGSTLTIGANNDGSEAFPGWISNFRLVKGTALYTSTFTPATSPLTAVSGTSILTCQSSTFVDNSSNNFSITVNGNSVPVMNSPFNLTYSTKQSYTPTVNGGSMFFDGNGDLLTTPTTSVLSNFWNNDCTVECWVYFNSVASTPHIWSISESSNVRVTLYLSGAAFRLYTQITTGGDIITSTTTLTPGRWYHVAVTILSGTWTLWLNGVSQGTSTNTRRPNGPSEMVALGWQNYSGAAGDYLNGYISDFRAVTGTALYRSAFVPNNQPLTPISNTVMLLNGASGGIIDSAGIATMESMDGIRLVDSPIRYGNTSLFFDGTSDEVQLRTPAGALTLSGDFTVEASVYLTSTSTGYMTLFSSGSFYIRFGNSGFNNLLQCAINDTGVSAVYSCNQTKTALLNTWVHIAMTRASGVVRLFVNGTQQNLGTGGPATTFGSTSFTDNTTVGGASTWIIGGGSGGTWFGNISDFRLTRGLARYVANFTPPTSGFLAR